MAAMTRVQASGHGHPRPPCADRPVTGSPAGIASHQQTNALGSQLEGFPDLLKGDDAMSTWPPPALAHARWIDLTEGDRVSGRVVRLPERAAPAGTRLFLKVGDEIVAFPAVGRRGWTVLETALADKRVHVDDRIAVEFRGWRETADGERRYRDVRLEVLGRAS
jgi:hypothetical protein